MKTIVFSEDVKDFVFEVFNKSVDEDGYIVEKGNKLVCSNENCGFVKSK